MVFSSLYFLFLYLPIVLLVYYITPLKWRNLWLLVVNLIFYGWGEPKYILLMIFTIVLDYFCGLIVARRKLQGDDKGARTAVAVALVLNLAILFFFKYWDLVARTFQHFGVGMPVFNLTLPIGISFYTFQTMTYPVDIYRGDAEVQKSIVSFGTFVTLFPQLIAGPIIKYKELADQMTYRTHSPEQFASGVQVFVVGLAKKVLLANNLAMLAENAFGLDPASLSAGASWLGAIAYLWQVYFDFSGYSDMAIGLGKMLGFDFPENFRYPYAATSVTDFWRRWHMTLSSWFRDYVYIPLGGNRRGKARQLFNLLITWLLTGFWHGASWNFVLWGLYYFAFLALEKLFLSKWLDRAPKLLGWAYTLLVTLVGWVLFAFESLPQGLAYLSRMFGAAPLLDAGFVYAFLSCLPLLVLMALGAVGLPAALASRWSSRLRPGAEGGLRLLAALVLLLLCTASVTAGSYNPFLYFRF